MVVQKKKLHVDTWQSEWIDSPFYKKLLSLETSQEYLSILIFGQEHQAISYNILGL